MKRKAGSRIVAMLLTLCMVLGIMPASPAGMTASAALADISINFADAWVNGQGSNGYQPVLADFAKDGWEINQEMTMPNYYGAGNGQRVSDGNTAALARDAWIELRMGKYNVPNDFTINVNSPAAGTYDLSFTCYHLSSGSDIAVFVNREFVGNIKTYNTTAGEQVTSLDKVWLNKGTNTVTFARLGDSVQFLLKKMEFTNGVAGTSYGFDKVAIVPEKTTIAIGKTMTVTGGVLMTNGAYRFVNGVAYTGLDRGYVGEVAEKKNTCSLTSSNTAVGTVSVNGKIDTRELSYTFTAVDVGKTTLTMTAKVNGEDKVVTQEIEVVEATAGDDSPSDIIIDFGTLNPEGKDGKFAITATVEKNGWQINTTDTSAQLIANNGIAGADGLRASGACIDVRPNAVASNDLKRSTIAFDVYANADAAYAFSIDYTKYASGAEMAVFVNEKYVGTVSNVGTSYETGSTTLNSVMLKKGVNKVTFRRTGGVWYVFFLNKLNFKLLEEMPTVTGAYVQPEKVILEEGESVNVDYGVKMSDGSKLILNGWNYTAHTPDTNNTISLESTNAQVASLSGSSLTGASAGTATLKVNAMVDGKPVTASIDVEVTEANLVPPEDIIIDFGAINPEWNASKYALKQTIGDDGWQLNTTDTSSALVSNNGTAGADGMRVAGAYLDVRPNALASHDLPRSTLAFDVYSNATAPYSLFVECTEYASGAEMAVFVNEKYVGTVNNVGKNSAAVGFELNDVILKRGINKISFRRTGGVWYVFFLNKIEFKVLDQMPTLAEAYVNPEKVMLKVGESVNVDFGARMSDGSKLHLNGWNYDAHTADAQNVASLAISNAQVASVSGSTLTAKALGTTTLKTNAIVNGQSISKTVEVNVVESIPKNQVIDFTKVYTASPKNEVIKSDWAVDGWKVNTEMTDPTMVSNNGKSSSSGGTMRATTLGLDVRPSGNNAKLTSDLTITVDVKANGVYTPVIDFYQFNPQKYTAMVDVYVDQKYVGSYNSFNETEGNASETMNTVYLTKGTHEFTFRRADSNLYFFVSKITLESGVSIPQVKRVFCDISKDAIALGGKGTTVSYGVEMSDETLLKQGKNFDAVADKDNTITLSVRDGKYATLSGNTIIGTEEGTAYVDAVGTVGGARYTASDKVLVEFRPMIPTISIKDSYGAVKGVNTEIQMTAKMDAHRQNFDGATISATVEDSSVADAYVRISQDKERAYLVVNGKKAGTTNINITGMFPEGSKDATATVRINVIENKQDSFVVDFTKMNPNDTNAMLKVTGQMVVDGWEVNPYKTDTTMWENNGATSGSFFVRAVSMGLDVRTPAFDTLKTSDLTIDVNVPESGAYKPSIEHLRFSSKYGAEVAVFIDGEYIGRYDCSQEGTETSAKTAMNSIYLEKGVHEFTFRRIENKVQFYVTKIYMDAIDAVPVIEGIDVEGNEILSVGESTILRPYVKMSDGSGLNLGKRYEGGNDTESNIICTNNTPGILQTVSDGNFKAITSGIGSVSYKNIISGEPYEYTKKVTVDSKVLDRVELSLDKDEIGWNDSANIVLKAYVGDREIAARDLKVEYTAGAGGNIIVDGATIKAVKAGETTLTAKVSLDSTTITKTIDVNIHSKFGIAPIENCQVALGSTSKYPLDIVLDGEEYDVGDAAISVSFDNPDIADAIIQLSEDGKRAYVIFSGNVANAQGNAVISITANGVTGNVTVPFTVLPAKQLYSFDISIDNKTLEVGASGKITLTAYGVDGLELKDAGIYYESSNPQVVVVENDGTVVARSAGTATITAHVAKDNVKLSKSLNVTIGGASDIVNVTLNGATTIVIGASANLSVSGKLKNGFNADLSKAAIVYEAVENDGVIELDASTGKVTALAAGTAKVKAVVTVGENAVFETQVKSIVVRDGVAPPVEPDPVPGDFSIDFRVNQAGTPFDMTMQSHGCVVDIQNTAANLVSGAQIFRWQPVIGLDIRPTGVDKKRDADVAFIFDVPVAGVYMPEIEYIISGKYGAITAVFVDGTYLGTYDASVIKTGVTHEKQELNSIYLDAGEHRITFRKLDSKVQVFISAINFRYRDSMPTFDKIVAEVDKALMSVGETATATVGALMSDGTFLQMGKAYAGGNDNSNCVKVTPRDTSKLTVNGTTITAVGVGNTAIDAKVVMDGKEHSFGIDITVDNKKLDSIEAELDTVLYKGGTAKLNVTGYTDDKREIKEKDLSITLSANATDIVTISDLQFKGVSAGVQKVKVSATMNGTTVVKEIDITVADPVIAKLNLASTTNTSMKPDAQGIQLTAYATDNMGGDIAVTPQSLSWSSSDESIITVNESGFVTPVSEGIAYVIATAQTELGVVEGRIEISVTHGKTSSTFYTAKKVKNARENVEKYDWAKKMKNTAVNTVEKYWGDWSFDEMWDFVTTNELPRGMTVGYWNDPEENVCRYCGVNQTEVSGVRYPWFTNPNAAAWKIQCRVCRRRFPSNDFDNFYKLGIDEHGNWSYELAKQKNAELVANGEKGYLVNVLYPEVATVKTLNGGRGLREKETVEGWGVDDGWGYKTGYSYSTANGTIEEVHTYIAHYNQLVWLSSYGGGPDPASISRALTNLRDAYLYTGDMKYGRLGAILVDRIADVYPDMKVDHFYKTITNNGSYYLPSGRVLGAISENELVNPAMLAYDAFYDCYEDPMVISFLSGKAKQYNFENDKATPRKIRENIENNLIREVRKAVIAGDNEGNFGMHQSSMAYAAVVLDSHPETEQMVDYVFANADPETPSAMDGAVASTLVNSINRDGGGDEGSVAYNMLWLERLKLVADALADYPDDSKNLYRNPQYIKMHTAFAPMIMTRKTLIQLGDAGNTADENIGYTVDTLIDAYMNSANKVIGQLIYFANGNKTDGLHSSIFSDDAEKIRSDIDNLIATEGEYDFSASRMLTGYGVAILRDGDFYKSDLGNVDTQRDFWISFAQNANHGHCDTLNLGIHAYGLDFAPDLGYPGKAVASAYYYNWGKGNISHNTVMINDTKMHGFTIGETGLPRHFDDSGRVKLIDVDAEYTYDNVKASIFRRTVVMIEASDEVSYGVDFFRVRGGSDHKYVFHALSDTISSTENLNFVSQPMGTYAGVDVPYGSDPVYHSHGLDYLTDVRRAQQPGVNEFAVDFKITDFRNTLKNPDLDLHLKMTMLNDFAPNEVALADGSPYDYNGNPQDLQFILVNRKGGNNLDSLFTTVYEPYNKESYILSEEQVPMDIIGGTPGIYDTAKAVKITFKNGRVDYVVYATNNKVAYNVDGLFDFRGFVAVYTLEDGAPIYTYLNDGDLLDGQTYTAAHTGKIVDFTKGVVMDNYLTVDFDAPVDPEGLAGEYIYINNGDVEKNAVYEVIDAKQISANRYSLYIGMASLARTINDDMSYTYNIEEGQTFRMPIATVDDNAPTFNNMQEEYSAAVGHQFSLAISAQSQLGREIKYTDATLPRGASFDEETGIITWKPDEHQVGDNHFSVTVSDGVLESTAHFVVEVFKSSSSGGSSGAGSTTPSTPSTPSTPTTPTTPTTPETPVEPDAPATGEGEGAGSTPDTPAEKFVDLGNHTWAKDAIYGLVDKSVVNGTSANTYSPANNIKRADFAIMLVRAFGIAEGEGENFADVDSNKYYAEELRLAKAAGIVNGVGDDKFNPEGEITRQDMMLMLSRALDAMEVELSEADLSKLADFADAAQISDYAADAVSRMIKDGIIAGSNGKINPLAKATRAEIAVMLNRVLADK